MVARWRGRLRAPETSTKAEAGQGAAASRKAPAPRPGSKAVALPAIVAGQRLGRAHSLARGMGDLVAAANPRTIGARLGADS
ncbi:hypothetical protein [Burkholderia plantarii]|uniref:hypothetical protein n=1 Tax=Burkholderia plantarii TaxID=41899 RepID=UPI0025565BA1|nr:hypothetical protein [Burkholderia plantarii]